MPLDKGLPLNVVRPILEELVQFIRHADRVNELVPRLLEVDPIDRYTDRCRHCGLKQEHYRQAIHRPDCIWIELRDLLA